ncbi:hypothetical protein ACFL21_01715 [Patescibacteria group bacterium]
MITKLDSQNFEGNLELFRELFEEAESLEEVEFFREDFRKWILTIISGSLNLDQKEELLNLIIENPQKIDMDILSRVVDSFQSESGSEEMEISNVKELVQNYQDQQEKTSDPNELQRIERDVYELIARFNTMYFNLDIDDTSDEVLDEGQAILDCLFDLYREISLKIQKVLEELSDKLEMENEDLDIQQMGSDFLNIGVIKLEQIFVPTPGESPALVDGNGDTEFEKPKFINRLTLIYEVLQELGVKKCMLFEGCNHPSMMRELNYNLVVIPELDRVILVCEEEGNRTFVRQGLADLPAFYRSSKQELKVQTNVKDFIWTDPKKWKQILGRYLKNDFVTNVDLGEIIRDEKYYRNPEIVRKDLKEFAQQFGLKSMTEINNSKRFARQHIKCRNGEKIYFRRYLSNAGVALGMAKNSGEADCIMFHILQELFRIAGEESQSSYEGLSEDFSTFLESKQASETFPERDENYYKNSEKVRADLEKIAEECGLESPLQLSTANIYTCKEFECFTGELVQFQTYLLQAGKALSLSRNITEAATKKAGILRKLLRIAGYNIEEYQDRDENYYRNSKKVRADLEAYAEHCGLDSGSKLLTTHREAKAKCSTGEELRLAKYLTHGGKVLGIASASSNLAKDLKELKMIAGYEVIEYEVRDGKYYRNPTNVRADLSNFALDCGLESPNFLSGSHKFRSKLVKCSNGENVRFDRYLSNAGVALKMAKNCTESKSIKLKVLRELLKIAGYMEEFKV